MVNNNLRKGILLAFLASIISGLAIFYSKISVAKIPPLVLTTSRNFYVGFLFLFLFLVSGRVKELRKLKKKQLLLLTLIGFIGGALPFYLFFNGLQYISAINANLIQKTLFVWVTILAVIFLKERITVGYFISFGLIFIANFFFAKSNLALGKGEFMVLAATLFWSVENIMAKKVLKNISSELVGLFRMGIGGSLLMLTTLITGKGQTLLSIINQPASAEATAGKQLTIILVGGTILFFYVYTWYKALKYAPASLATLILTFAVVVGNILNGAFAGVKILPKEVYSSLLISAAAFIILIKTNVIPNLFRDLLSKNQMLK